MTLRFDLTQDPDAETQEAARKLFAGPVGFVKGVVAMSGLPPADRIEVCFAGRPIKRWKIQPDQCPDRAQDIGAVL